MNRNVEPERMSNTSAQRLFDRITKMAGKWVYFDANWMSEAEDVTVSHMKVEVLLSLGMNDLPKIPLTDEDYERFEEQIPALAERATREAYERAIQSGLPVTILIGNTIVQVLANGLIKEIKKLPETRQRITQQHFKIA